MLIYIPISGSQVELSRLGTKIGCFSSLIQTILLVPELHRVSRSKSCRSRTLPPVGNHTLPRRILPLFTLHSVIHFFVKIKGKYQDYANLPRLSRTVYPLTSFRKKGTPAFLLGLPPDFSARSLLVRKKRNIVFTYPMTQ